MNWIKDLYRVETAFRWESRRLPWLMSVLKKIDYGISLIVHTLNLLLLIVIFYLVFTPLGFFLRRQDPMSLRWPPRKNTARRLSEPLTDDHFERPY